MRLLPCLLCTLSSAVALAVAASVVPLPARAAPAAKPAPGAPSKLKPIDQALYITRNGIKSADFHARGMAYRALAWDKGNKEAWQLLKDGATDPQWVVRRGVAEAMFKLKVPQWTQVVHEGLGLPVLNPYEVLPVLDEFPDKDAFAVLAETLGDKELDQKQQDRIGSALVGRNRPNLGDFLKFALASKDALVVQSAQRMVVRLDPVLQGKALDIVAKAQPQNDALVKALLDIAAAADDRVGATFLQSLKPKDTALQARLLTVRALHGDRGVGQALVASCAVQQGKEQLECLAAYKRVADKRDADALKSIIAKGGTHELLFAAYELIARMGDRSMASQAQHLAESTDTDMRATGVFYLGWVGGVGRISEMHEYLDDGIAAVRVAAGRVLGYIASPISVAPLRDRLDRETEERVKIELIRALAAIKHKDAYQGLMFYTREKDNDVRRIVVRALAESGDVQARQGLQNALNDNDPRIRAEAVRGFLLSDPAKSVDVWKRMVKKLPRGTVIDLTREMTTTMTGFLELALLGLGNDDDGTALREEALLALHLLPQEEPILLDKVLNTTEDEDLRIRVLRQLVELQPAKVGVQVKSLALASPTRVRVAATRLLTKLKGDKEAGEILVKLLDETDERVRIAAALTLLGG